jgi:hypothetical protein
LGVNDANENPTGSETVSAGADFDPITEVTADAEELSSAETGVTSASAPSAKHGVISHAISAAMPPMIAIIAWFVPGSGHLLLRRWQRAVAFFVTVGGLAMTGYLMRGNVFAPHSEDPFGTLGFLADASSGVFYLLGHLIEKAGPDVARAMGDYGTRFIAGAGIINMMGVCDAFEVARGRKF